MTLKKIFILLVALVAGLTGISAVKSKQTKPNIIIVITDDQGKNDLGCEGNPYIKTPNIDKFYNNAVRFNNFHVSTTCAPTRGALLTGRHTDRLNVFHTISGRSLLFEDEVLLPQILAQNGYATGMFGKWHLGDNYPFRPMDRGFQEVVRHGGGGVGQGPDYWGNDYFDDTYWHNGETQKYEGYCTDVFFAEALKFMEQNKEKPFFAYLSTNAPHGPFNCPEEYIDLYEGDDSLPEYIKRFYGMITNIDDNFKTLRDKLAEWGIAENTILIFMTDNGTAGGQRMYDAGMTGHKGEVTEGGHRTPFYMQWPAGEISGGKDIDELTAHYDVLPTLVDLLQLNFTPAKPLDGKSLVPLLKEKIENWPNRVLFMDTQRMLNLTKYKNYTVMDKDYRLVDGDKLNNVTTDLKQSDNIINQHPEVAERLALGYEKWWQSLVDEGVNERYAYIKVGTPYENPSRIMSHDMLTGNLGHAWHQFGAITATQASGFWKIEFVEDGDYKISLRRFPRESGLKINATFPAEEKTRRIEKPAPASTKDDFTKAFLYVGKHKITADIAKDAEEVSFTLDVSAGKYDVQAELIDSLGRVYPSYYLYIEKL
ncbi:arylsulfatase [uncultured Draconibacterium sp.]|uniref:arylsulfatase n=1 Tax=uncultured Draconibacterium sp. TaxID=1573823 RepID=UPI0025F26CA6|nr:arylsulfatase [uncultured Draconibacterium sp.]